MNTALLSLPSGNWEVHFQLVQEPGQPSDHGILCFQRLGSPTSNMRASHLGDVDLDQVPPAELRGFARLAVYERDEKVEGALWTFSTAKPPPQVLIGLLPGYDPPRRVNFRNALGEGGVGELPPGRFLADVTDDELAVLVQRGQRDRGGMRTAPTPH